jgi:hypothetical protein
MSCKADTVVVVVRYEPEDGHLLLAWAYERRGAVWNDVVLLDRDAQVARIHCRRCVHAGEVHPDVPGDPMIHGRLVLHHAEGRTHLLLRESPARRDDLGVPIF